MRAFFLLVAMAFFGCVQAQTEADALQKELQLHPERDTTRAMILNRLSYFTYDPPQSKSYAEEALEISLEKDFKKGVGHAYYQLSQYYWKKTDSDKSIEYAFKALRIFEECMPIGISVCYSMIGINLAEQNEIEEAIRYHRMALALNTRNGNPGKMASDYTNIGNIYHDNKKDYDSALFYYNKSLEIVTQLNDRGGLLLAYNNIGSAYSLKGDHATGLEYLLKATPLAESLQNEDRMALVHQTLGEIYSRMHRYEEAKKHFELSLTIAQKIGNKRRKSEVYSHLKEMELARNNYAAAYHYLNELALLKDTVYNLERSAQIAEIQTQYETDKKAQQIKTLEQEKKIQTLWRNVLIVGMIVLTTGAYIFFRYRARKAKELLEIQTRVNEELSAIDKLKSQLYNNVAHEFRTPLSLILAPIENELRKNASGADRENLLLIRRSATRLLELINQLLDLSKLESGKMELLVTHGSLAEFVEDLLASFNGLAVNKQIEFTKNISLREQSYWFDSDALEKIISNLLANAFKFTPTGGEVKIDIGSLSEALISISVSDTGSGIPLKEQQHVFSPFYQVQQTTSGRQPGTGLGLSMVKEFVKLYNGTISLSSTPGIGTTFIITLPVNRDAFDASFVSSEKTERLARDHYDDVYKVEQEINGTLAYDQSKDSILLVEDNLDLRSFISDTLKTNGYHVVAVSDGSEGLAQAQQFIPNLILSDVMMPVMDGIELTKQIKTDERTSHIPVILLTAKNEQASRMDGLMMGADDYLTKPFSPQELLVRIQNLIEQRKKLSLKFRERILVEPAPKEGMSLDDKFLLSAKRVVEDNIRDPNLTVERLTEEMNMSRTQLFRKMKALTGLSPNDFIRNIRLQRAAEMITQKADTISQIGYAVGFSDQSYFTKSFKKQFGVTPTEYSKPANAEVKRVLG